MLRKNYKGRCEKRSLSKFDGACKTYNKLMYAYADVLESDENIKTVRCNVLLKNSEVGEYTSDFVATKVNGDLMVRECVMRNLLSKPMTAKLLDISKNYWASNGVCDWGIVTNMQEDNEK